MGIVRYKCIYFNTVHYYRHTLFSDLIIDVSFSAIKYSSTGYARIFSLVLTTNSTHVE